MKLAEIDALADEIERLLDESAGEITPEIEAKRALFDLSQADKVDAYVHMIHDMRARARIAGEQAIELTAKRKRLEYRADWLQAGIEAHMAKMGLRAIKGYTHRAAYQMNGGEAPLAGPGILHPDLLPSQYQRVTIEPDKVKLRAALEAGDPIAEQFVSLGERGERLRLY